MFTSSLLSICVSVASAQQSPIPFRRGDVDLDAHINITDAVVILLHLYRGELEPACAKSADADDNGLLESADAIYLLVYSFLSGPPPRDPFDDCGFDPTEDEISCLEYSLCPVVVGEDGSGDGGGGGDAGDGGDGHDVGGGGDAGDGGDGHDVGGGGDEVGENQDGDGADDDPGDAGDGYSDDSNDTDDTDDTDDSEDSDDADPDDDLDDENAGAADDGTDDYRDRRQRRCKHWFRSKNRGWKHRCRGCSDRDHGARHRRLVRRRSHD